MKVHTTRYIHITRFELPNHKTQKSISLEFQVIFTLLDFTGANTLVIMMIRIALAQ